VKVEYPVKDKTIRQPFGHDNTNHPTRGAYYTIFDNKHPGVDFPVPVGTEIFASFPGVVVRKESHLGMGNVLSVRNGNIVALYAHLSAFNVDIGEVVEVGQLIGISGESGDACGTPHLHFELRDISKNPLKNMVFEPMFEQECSQYKDSFTYVVNNTNTQKTLGNLAELYFGDEDMWERIKQANMLNLEKLDLLESGLELVIPNY
jgi:murein DD-endopeptidase MepM/ murein hydrolase activator NlpD